MIPYIGDLVSNNLLYDASRIADADTAASMFTDLRGPDLRPPVAIRTRADVAKTIYYRRRKGTLPMLEELARDVTGWAAHAVEFFELLGWTQNLEHIRPQAGWSDVRSLERDERVDGPFDVRRATRVDVRPISQDEGWHTIRNIGFFLWRLGAYPLVERPGAAEPGRAWRFHFSPLGNPMRRCSRTCAARATRRGSRPSCTCPGRSAARSSRRISTRTARPRRPTSPTSTARSTRRRRSSRIPTPRCS